jgi:predicted RNase H-like HicB family nuclease
MVESEIIFEIREDESDGGYTARALGHSIFTEGDTIEQLRQNVREAADCYFDGEALAPRIIRLHFVRDEVLAR